MNEHINYRRIIKNFDFYQDSSLQKKLFLKNFTLQRGLKIEFDIKNLIPSNIIRKMYLRKS